MELITLFLGTERLLEDHRLKTLLTASLSAEKEAESSFVMQFGIVHHSASTDEFSQSGSFSCPCTAYQKKLALKWT